MGTRIKTSVSRDYTIHNSDHPAQMVTVGTLNGYVHSLRILVGDALGSFQIPAGDGLQPLEFIRDALADIMVEIQADNDGKS
jgi:hypothetical protein